MPESNIFFERDSDNYLLESFRILRSNIYFLEKNKNKIIIFTSTIPNEGKTTISANYAMSEAVTGKKVILVNCDIRKFRPFDKLKKESYGIESVLLGEKKVNEVIIKEFKENLDLLPSQHYLNGDVTELFLNNRIKELLENLKKKYDLVVLDTSPLSIATDAAILSEYADGIVYVCGYNMVKKEKMIRAKKILERAGAKIYGIVINKIDEKTYVNEYGYDEYRYYNNYVNG
ncbi:MAG: CpsD/CapB family tyrosine-protein kinase [Psychrilyobacter sp.]|uniref:tyrosine-protein kinase family protein n=1 Tax=Psychrilyobacter sp. TaxID=2586924 RepID=UPI003C7214DA